MNCTLCPRHCGVDRTDSLGFCHAGQQPEIAAICVHHGEEPPISGTKGICNIFFAHCNLHCIYCQNWQISSLTKTKTKTKTKTAPAQFSILNSLKDSENILGFVTPTHYADRIPAIVEQLHAHGLHPVTVYNSSGYESVETLRMLEPYIDVYLPDFKYADPDLARRYSHAPDYPQRAREALLEMYRQKGSPLITDSDGLAASGIIVRHLVLPGCIDNSLQVLDTIADISPNLHVSLMAQYYPPREGLPDQLSRTLTQEEYDTVVNHLHSTGLHNGWIQDLSAHSSYRPDFNTLRQAQGKPFFTP